MSVTVLWTLATSDGIHPGLALRCNLIHAPPPRRRVIAGDTLSCIRRLGECRLLLSSDRVPIQSRSQNVQTPRQVHRSRAQTGRRILLTPSSHLTILPPSSFDNNITSSPFPPFCRYPLLDCRPARRRLRPALPREAPQSHARPRPPPLRSGPTLQGFGASSRSANGLVVGAGWLVVGTLPLCRDHDIATSDLEPNQRGPPSVVGLSFAERRPRGAVMERRRGCPGSP